MRCVCTVLLGSLLLACGTRTVADDPGQGESSSSSSPSTGEPSAETTTTTAADSSTGEPAPRCDCVDPSLVCEQPFDAIADCGLPQPCGRLDESNASVECIRQLLIAQQPGRFEYYFTNPRTYGDEEWFGWFTITGPGEGLDNECHIVPGDFGWSEETTASVHALELPEYFEACPSEGSDEARSCILAGLAAGEAVPECSPR